MAITIRPMSIDDFAPAYKLGLRCYDVQDRPSYSYWTIREVAHHLETSPHLCYVAEDDNRQVVGFALGEEDFVMLENTGYLEWVAVAPEYRRQGIASQLVETLLRVYQRLGKSRVVSDISSTNAASRRLVRKLGFTEGISLTFFVKELG